MNNRGPIGQTRVPAVRYLQPRAHVGEQQEIIERFLHWAARRVGAPDL